ncbi:MAG: VIT domain-containing protein [Sutterellaceae bacterium]|nr:VIT domain-containing protein [Sutterellaceae bacterium]
MLEENTLGLTGENADAVLLKSIRWEGNLSGLLLILNSRQTFHHTGKDVAEVAYSFPLSHRSVVTDVSVTINGERLSAQLLKSQEADDTYERGISEGDLPVMLEISDPMHGIATINLGNVKPGDTVEIEITTAQILDWVDGAVRVVIPTVIPDMYSADGRQGQLLPHQRVETDMTFELPVSVQLTVTGECAQAKSISCLTHPAKVTHESESLVVTIDNAYADRDIAVKFEDVPAINAVYACEYDCIASGVAVFTPPKMYAATNDIKVKLLVDCSGSMVGISIAQVRRALAAFSDRLTPKDEVALMRFGNRVDTVIGQLSKATDRFLRRDFLPACADIQADLGGTEMEKALQHALSLEPDARADVLLITDGEVWGMLDVDDAIASGVRVHVIHVGSASCVGQLKELAAATGGHFERVMPAEDMSEAVGRVVNAMRGRRLQAVKLAPEEFAQFALELPTVLTEGASVPVYFNEVILSVVTSELTCEAGGAQVTLRAKVQPIAVSLKSAVRKLVGTQIYNALEDDEKAAFAAREDLLTPDTKFVLVKERAEDEKTDGMPQLQQVPQMPVNRFESLPRILRTPMYCVESFSNDKVEMDCLLPPPPCMSFPDELCMPDSGQPKKKTTEKNFEQFWFDVLQREIRAEFGAGLERTLNAENPFLDYVYQRLCDFVRAVVPGIEQRLGDEAIERRLIAAVLSLWVSEKFGEHRNRKRWLLNRACRERIWAWLDQTAPDDARLLLAKFSEDRSWVKELLGDDDTYLSLTAQ